MSDDWRAPPAERSQADDHPVNRKVATAMLKSLGVQEISLAVDGLSAVSLATQHRYDVILMARPLSFF